MAKKPYICRKMWVMHSRDERETWIVSRKWYKILNRVFMFLEGGFVKRVLLILILLTFVCEGVNSKMEKFVLVPLPYNFNALEPHLDARTV